MVAKRIQRKATTPKGFLKRTKDGRFDEVPDPRNPKRSKHPLDGVLELGVVGLATDTPSTRGVEKRSEQLDDDIDEAIDLDGRIADNTFGLLLRRPEPVMLAKALHRAIKAEWSGRENLRPTRLNKSTVAIDGKHLATLTERQLRDLLEAETDLKQVDEMTFEELKTVFATQFPAVQLRNHKDGRIDGLVRVHRATLVSTDAAVVIDQQTIGGQTNEQGAILGMLRSVFSAYKRTKMVQRITVDAGNATKEAAAAVIDHGADYLFAIKSPQGAIHERATEMLGGCANSEATFTHCEDTGGKTITHTIWQTSIPHGMCGWPKARQLIRLERVTLDNDGELTIGNRYFVSSEPVMQTTGKEAYRIGRAHWRCENEGHWTCDAVFKEDVTRTPWTRHPTGILNVGILRVFAINILAMLRAMSRLRVGDKLEVPTWRDVIEHAIFVLLEPILETAEFDTFDV